MRPVGRPAAYRLSSGRDIRDNPQSRMTSWRPRAIRRAASRELFSWALVGSNIPVEPRHRPAATLPLLSPQGETRMNVPWKCIVPVVIGVVVWFLPVPEGVTPKAWHMLAVFVGTIVGIIM